TREQMSKEWVGGPARVPFGNSQGCRAPPLRVPPMPPPGKPMRGPDPPRLPLLSFTFRWLERVLGSSLSSRFNRHAPRIFLRGGICTVRVAGPAGIEDGGGVTCPPGPWANAPTAKNNTPASISRNLLNFFMFFFPEAVRPARTPLKFIPAAATLSSQSPSLTDVSESYLTSGGVGILFSGGNAP